MVGENFVIFMSHVAKTDLKLSTMVGENFVIFMSEMAKTDLKFSTMVEEILKLTYLKWL